MKLVCLRHELAEKWVWKRRPAEEVEVILESRMPTRSSRLMSSESHRRMAETVRARRRGGKRRYGVHRKVSTRCYDPSTKDDCGFDCIL